MRDLITSGFSSLRLLNSAPLLQEVDLKGRILENN